MTNFSYSLFYIALLFAQTMLFATENVEKIHKQIADIYEKRVQILSQIDLFENEKVKIDSRTRLITRDLAQNKELYENYKKEYRRKINQAVYWHYNQKRMIWQQLRGSGSLDGPSICRRLIQNSKSHGATLEKQSNIMEKTLSQLNLEKKQYTTLYQDKMLLLSQLDEEEEILKNILNEMEKNLEQQLSQTQNYTNDTIDTESVFHFDYVNLIPPIKNMKSRRLKDFLGAKIISAKTGEAIKAISRGTVIFADELKGLGQMIIIEHPDKYMSLYANCSKITKKVGEIVTRDDIIAHVGMSGQIGEEALYFELRHDGEIIPAPGYWMS